ncbi:MAG TPA: hypothetical protein VK638_50355 [Edaphobacter sp.]|nr:hypothetical protein [Edaphobacter sp.]
MAGKAVTLQRVADLIDDLKADFNAKHKENVDRRHQIIDRYSELEGRVTVVETQMRAVIGDNSGGSGLLHEIDKKVDSLSSEFAGIKKVLVFLAFIIPIVVAIALAVIYKH